MIGNKADKAVLVVVSVWFNRLQNTFLCFKKSNLLKTSQSQRIDFPIKNGYLSQTFEFPGRFFNQSTLS